MKIAEVFDSRVEQYEDWFTRNRWAYLSELELLRRLVPPSGRGLEIGVGTGKFASPLGIPLGVDVAEKMMELAQKRGVKTVRGDAHNLPFEDNSFDYALMMVTICFVDDPPRALAEAHRILRRGGTLILGIIDKSSPLGKIYLNKQQKSPFYRYARFFSADELISLLRDTGFQIGRTLQTLFSPDLSSLQRVDEIREGFGEGGFVGIEAIKA